MTNKRLALALFLTVLLVSATLFATINQNPDPARVGRPVTFEYDGDGTVYEWCFQEPGSSRWDCEESDSDSISHTFDSAGEGAVKVNVDLGRGTRTETSPVTVEG